jgi:WD40 repeat protein
VFSDEANGVLASAGRDGGIRIWDAKKFSDPELIENNASIEPNSAKTKPKLLVTTLYGHAAPVTTLAFTGDHKKIVSGSEDKTLKIWSLDTRPSGTLVLGSTATPKISSLAFSYNRLWLAAGRDDGSTMIWNLNQKTTEGVLLKTPRASTPGVTPVAFSKNQILAVATGNSDVTLWQTSNLDQPFGTLIRKDKDGKDKGRVMALAFSDDGEWLATGGADNEVWLWEVATLEVKKTKVPKNSKAILSLAFAPGSKVLAIGTTNSTVELWDTDTGEEMGSLKGHHTDAVGSIAFSPDGSTIATGSSDTTVQLWNARTHQRFATLQGHSQRVLSVSFLGDSKRLVTAGADGSVRLWDSDGKSNQDDTRDALVAFQGKEFQPAFAVAVSSDGSILGTGNADGTVLLRYGASK